MNTLGKSQASENTTEAKSLPEDSASRIERVLQSFEVLPSKKEQHFFRYGPLYLLGSSLLLLVLTLAGGVLLGYPKSSPNYMSFVSITWRYLLLPLVGTSLFFWVFNVWWGHVPRILRDIFEKRRIDMPAGDVDTQYLEFLEHYRDALRNPRRYLLIGGLMAIIAIELINHPSGPVTTIKSILASSPRVVDIIFWGLLWIIAFFINLGLMYGLGITSWTLSITGRYIRNLSRAFEFRIEPVHPDHCGGLKVLGDFCFGLAFPPFTGFVFTIGYLFVLLRDSPNTSDLITAGLTAFILLLFVLPGVIFLFFVPLWSIHTKMLAVRAREEEAYAVHLTALREEIQMLLSDNRLEEAKTVKETRGCWKQNTFLTRHGHLISGRNSSPLSSEQVEVSCSASLRPCHQSYYKPSSTLNRSPCSRIVADSLGFLSQKCTRGGASLLLPRLGKRFLPRPSGTLCHLSAIMKTLVVVIKWQGFSINIFMEACGIGALPHIKCACLLSLDGKLVLHCFPEKDSLRKNEVNEDGSVAVSPLVGWTPH
jgi:hypothetical protein